MKRTSPADWKAALGAAGARSGDVLMLHSHLPSFGLVDPEGLIAATLDFLGPAGTLVMPAFTLSFGKSRVFDRENTPSETGALTELFRKRPGTRRSLHPFHSVCAAGARAEELAEAWAPSSFGRGGPFERLHESDALLLCAGVGAERLTFVHYAEESVGVPYRAMKDFPGRVSAGGGEDGRVYRMYARDPRFKLDLPDLGAKLASAGLPAAAAPLAYGTLSAWRAKPAFDAFARLLRADPGALLVPGSPIAELLAGRITCTL